LKISSYYNLSLQRPSDIDEWKRWLATKGPILTRLDVDRTWYDASDNSGNLDAYRPETARGGHAVALVGYTPDRFIIRNSWGTGWGDKGFGYASLAYAQDAFTEAYGVST
jgi:C1A family cysteine protease